MHKAGSLAGLHYKKNLRNMLICLSVIKPVWKHRKCKQTTRLTANDLWQNWNNLVLVPFFDQQVSTTSSLTTTGKTMINTADDVQDLAICLNYEMPVKNHIAKVVSVCLSHPMTVPDPMTFRTSSQNLTSAQRDYDPSWRSQVLIFTARQWDHITPWPKTLMHSVH